MCTLSLSVYILGLRAAKSYLDLATFLNFCVLKFCVLKINNYTPPWDTVGWYIYELLLSSTDILK